MLAMVNMKPDSRNAGRNVATIATWLASSWLLVTMLIEHAHRQRARPGRSAAMPNSSATLPRSGTWNRNSPISTASSTSNMPMTK